MGNVVLIPPAPPPAYSACNTLAYVYFKVSLFGEGRDYFVVFCYAFFSCLLGPLAKGAGAWFVSGGLAKLATALRVVLVLYAVPFFQTAKSLR